MSEHRWQKVAQKLKDILLTDVEWGRLDSRPEGMQHSGDSDVLVFPTDRTRGLWVAGSVSDREKQLISLLVEREKEEMSTGRGRSPKNQLIAWLREVEQSRDAFSALPSLGGRFTLSERIPFYVARCGEHVLTGEKEVIRVIQSFFDEQVWVLSMSTRDYLLLPLAGIVYEGDEAEEWQEMLWHWADGLVEMFTSELSEDVRAVVHPPVETIEELGKAWLEIKQTFSLGMALHPGRRVFATWDMALERLLQALPREERRAFLEDVASASHTWWKDQEMRETLETFFRLNLNVSETARQLYVHRNTLLYRLDKLKQETGRDVRRFEDAILIRLALLMTKP